MEFFGDAPCTRYREDPGGSSWDEINATFVRSLESIAGVERQNMHQHFRFCTSFDSLYGDEEGAQEEPVCGTR